MKLKFIYRVMVRQRTAIVLNVVCLSIAFAVLFVVVKQVVYDFSYDKCYPQSENIGRLEYYDKGSVSYNCFVGMPTVQRVMPVLPEITDYAVTESKSWDVSYYFGEKEFTGVPSLRVTSGFLKVFQPRILAGDAEDALRNNAGVVIPQSLARKWFGDENPINQQVGFGSKVNLWNVKAVYEDFPENSSMVNAVYTRLDWDKDDSQWNYCCFFRKTEQADVREMEQKMVQVLDSIYPGRIGGVSSGIQFELSSMKDVYFNPDIQNPLKPNGGGNLSMTLCLLAIGVLIIIIAYINFVNFSTALAPSRVGTMNMRKVSGASDKELRFSIILESVFLSVVACLLAVVWVYSFSITDLSRAYFSVSLNPFESVGLYLLVLVGAIASGVLAGIYPSHYMTSFQPAVVLKGSFAMGERGRRLRNGLLVFQYTVAVMLIIVALFVSIQSHYLRNHPWGYQKENIVYSWSNEQIKKSPEVFRDELLKNPDILDVTAADGLPGRVDVKWGNSFMNKSVDFTVWHVANNFLHFLGIPVVEGEDFKEGVEGGQMILNRKMVEKYELKEMCGEYMNNYHKVVGVAENVNFASLRNDIGPMAFVSSDNYFWDSYVFIKIRPERVAETIGYIKSCFKKMGSDDSDVVFLDDSVNRLYQKEKNLSQLVLLLCFITMMISLAGIYGLVVFNIRYKIKEIGIRKINGATNRQVLLMLNRIFIRLVTIGFVVACPLAYWGVDSWLGDYAYRVPVYWWVFLLAGFLVVLITLFTVCFQSWKAANANPVDALRTE